jgi:ribosomal protein L11 methyltransferase
MPAEWIEVSLTVDGEGAEAAADALRPFVHQGVVIEQLFPGEAWEDEPLPPGLMRVSGYFSNDTDAADKRQAIERTLYYLGRLYDKIPAPTFTTVDADAWADAWKRHYHPVRVGKHILIKPAWVDITPERDDIVIELDPGMAFGTGTHPTTQLCLMACEWFVRPATTMVDIGTGSGILSIAAAKMGCYRVLALDTDEMAVKAARENIARNGVADRVTALHGSVESLQGTGRHFNLGMANLTAKIINEIAPHGLQHAVWPGSKFVFSGIIEDQVTEVVETLKSIDLDLLGKRQIGDWVMLITQRRSPR